MLRLITPEPQTVIDEPLPPDVSQPDAAEYELVVGRRQIFAISFLVLVLVAASAGASYVLGKAAGVRLQTAREPEPPPPVIQLDPAPAPAIEATITPAPVLAEPSLFAEPVSQAIYIQIGAVEKGVAVVLAEGLRKRKFDSFVAQGPSEKVFRVLVGPFPDAEAYQRAKTALDELGLSNFARRYQK